MERIDIKSLTREELRSEMIKKGEKPFRGDQIYQWIHEKQAEGFAQMSNLSRNFREQLEEEYEYIHLEIVEVQRSKLDGTCKYLFRLPDGYVIESVLMPYHHGNSVCISSQAGCRMGCRFCASTIGGLERNLRPSEMLDQVYQIQKNSGERVSNVVIMGTGEPLDNYENMLTFLHILSGEGGLHISQRNITVSTCGIVPGIRKLADEKLQITLALSLHAPTQEKRQKLMPIANQYDLEEVLDACTYYYRKTGRRLTFEYSLLEGINDSIEDAEALAALVKPVGGHVNLIPVNPVTERNFKRPTKKVIDNFKNKLEKCGINGTLRREMGRDIDGACGQLRKRYMRDRPENTLLDNADLTEKKKGGDQC